MREMKDSGVAWLGDIDSRFDIKAIGNLFTIKKDIIGREPDQVLSITQRGIKIKDTTSNEGQNAASYAHYQIVNVGDFAMNHMDLLTGWVDISRYEGVTSPDYRVFILTDNTQIPEYFLRVFQMYYSNRVFYAFGQGAANLGRWRLPRENFVKISIPCPPVELQRKIVDEIASKVSKVDALVANQQAQIEKLKQYKQSLITEVVTKGLKPDAPMKDSGVEWIGTVPLHWTVCKQKYEMKLINGRAYKDTEFENNGKYRILRVGNLFSNPVWYTSSLELEPEKYCEAGDLLYAWSMSYAPVIWTGEKVIFHYHIWKVILSNNIDKLFAYYYLIALTNAIRSEAHETTMGFITMGIMNNAYLAFPSKEEQEEIALYLSRKCNYIDRLITIKQKKINQLGEYKKSLIYEYVTGKKEVV